MTTSPPEFRLSLSPRAHFEHAEGGLRVLARGCAVRLGGAPAQALEGALERLANGGATEDTLSDEVLRSSDPSTLFSLYSLLRTLDGAGVLKRCLVVDGRPFATLIPSASTFRFKAGLLQTGPAKLSRFAFLRRQGESIRLESPLGRAQLDLEPRAAAVTLALTRAQSVDDLESQFPELSGAPIHGLLVLLQNTAALVDGDDQESPEAGKARQTPADWWDFPDLLLHMRSRRGRHDAPYGGTYRRRELAPPLVKPRGAGAVIALPRPDIEKLRATDSPFADVLERRRSIRAYGPDALTLEELGEFLFRAARYQRILPGEGTDFAFRPAPAGGALHELEIYPLVARCRGVAPGAYRYDPAAHELVAVAPPSPLFERVLDEAWQTGNRGSPINVFFQITARCQRVFWKYESMAYALILKNLGALYATMYLVATAMGLAPCALGGGDSELFSQLTGLDPCEEPAVGEFLLGSRAIS